MLFPNMSSLLRTKERLSYSVCSTLIRAFGLSSHRTNFEKFENKSKNYFKSTSSEGKSVKFEKLGKWTSHDEINERFKKANARLQAANLEASINFDNTEKSTDHEMFGNLSGDDDTEHSTVEMETTEIRSYRRYLKDLIDTEEQELSIKDYFGMSKTGKNMLKSKDQIEEDLKKIDAMILSKRQGKQIETKVSMPNIQLCNKVLFLIGKKRYIGSMDKAFDIYELMSQHGPEPNELTYNAIIKACINSRFPRKEDILKIAKKLLRDIQDRGIQIDDATHKALMNLFAQGIDSKILIDLIPFLLDEVGEKHSGSILSIVLNSSLNDRQRGFHDAICAWRLIACRVPSIKPTLEDFRTLLLITYHCEIANEDEFERMLHKTAYPYSNEEFSNGSKRHEVKNNSPFAFRNERDEMDLSKDEHTRCTLGTENNSNAESQLKKSTQIELTEMVELLEMDTRQKKKKRTSSNHLSFPLNVKREHKISDILNPFETLPSVISLPGRITSEDRKSLLDGIKEFRIRVIDAGGVTGMWMKYRAKKTPMTIAIESSLLRLGLERTAVGTELYAGPIVNRMYLRHDNAATKEMLRILEQSDKRKLVPQYFFDILCSRLDNERDVFQFLNFMQMVGSLPDIKTFRCLFRSSLALYDLSYQKKLLMEMSWLNVCPDGRFLRLMNESILDINSEILKQIKEDLKKKDGMILSKRHGIQIETKFFVPKINLCNEVLSLIGKKGRKGYIGLDKVFGIYELMSQHGPEPNELTYNAIIKACINSRFSRREEILKIAKTLLRDIQDRGIQIHDATHKALMNLFAQGIDSKILIDLIPFLLDEVGEKHSGSILSIVLNSSLNDRQRGFHDAICAWRLIACRVPSIKPTLEDFRTLLLITYHCEIANEDEFERMLQKTAYPYSNEEFWNGSKRHEVKNNPPFAFRNERNEMDLSKDEHTRCTLGTENNSNAEGQLKKSTQIELTEMIELLEMDTRQKKKMITSSNHLSFPLNVKREHKISDILNPFETLPSVILLPGRIPSEDRKSLLDGIKEFRIRVHDAGAVTHKWMRERVKQTPMTIAIESSLLRLGLEKTAVGTELYAIPIAYRMHQRRDHAAAKEMWRILEQSDKKKLVPHYFFNTLCSTLDNERDVFQFLHFMQMVGSHPDIKTFDSLFRSHMALYDLSYQKKLLMEMSWLNVCPDGCFLRLMNESILDINRKILKQENSSRDVEYTDKSYISREEFENFVTFYHEWLTMYNL